LSKSNEDGGGSPRRGIAPLPHYTNYISSPRDTGRTTVRTAVVDVSPQRVVAAERLMEQVREEKRAAIEKRQERRRQDAAAEAEAKAKTGRIAHRWMAERQEQLDNFEVRSPRSIRRHSQPAPRVEPSPPAATNRTPTAAPLAPLTPEPRTQRADAAPLPKLKRKLAEPDSAYVARIKEEALAKSIADRRRRQQAQRIDAPRPTAATHASTPEPVLNSSGSMTSPANQKKKQHHLVPLSASTPEPRREPQSHADSSHRRIVSDVETLRQELMRRKKIAQPERATALSPSGETQSTQETTHEGPRQD
jgi:hypothetical protein